MQSDRFVNPKKASAMFSEVDYSSGVMRDILKLFSVKINRGETEIYNEFSLQHELGIFLRNAIKGRLVQFERNVSFFGFAKDEFVKREVDITVYGKDGAQLLLDAAIELKFPRNGQHPEQMFSFCKDIVFVEQLKRSGFNKSYLVIFAEDPLFYEGDHQDGIYGFFRGGHRLTGTVRKPTGKRDSELIINGDYQIKWNDVKGSLKYTLIEAQ